MRKDRLWLALGSLALVGIGGVIGAAANGFGSGPRGSDAPTTAAAAVLSTAPDAARAMRDLLGATTTGLPRTVPGERAEIWATREFSFDGVRHHSVFFAIKTLGRDGAVADCRACFARIAAVTYRQTAAGWELAHRDRSIAELGSYGKPPAAEKMSAVSLGATPGLAIEDRWTGQGEVSVGATLIAYRSGWKNLGWIQMGKNNAGTAHCEMDGSCFAWHGNLKVADTQSGELPDITVERDGTELDEAEQKLRPVMNVTYEFRGSKYVEKTAPVPAHGSQPGSSLPAQVAVAGSETAPRSEQGRQWYTPDVNRTRCIKSRSPADKIQTIQDYGKPAKVVDLPNGAVEVSEQTSSFEERFWVYYPSEALCTAALPRSQPIPPRYR